MASSTNNEKIERERPTVMFQGKNIHSSPVDGKLLCSFSEKTCMQRRLNHYAFCIRHVLEDKNSPFKQCKFVAKYNGQRCTNAIPLKEDRIYCNSHLQVLGLVPKKSRKKKANEQSLHTAKNTQKSSSAEILLPVHRGSQTTVSKRSERAGCRTESLKTSPEQRISRNAKLLSSNPLLCQLVEVYSQADNQKRNLLPFYGVCSSDDSESDEDEKDLQTNRKQLQSSSAGSSVESLEHSSNVRHSSRSVKLQRLREKLHSELLYVRKTISSHDKCIKQSDQALGLLVNAMKSSPALTTAAIHGNKNLLGSRKRSASAKQVSITCTAQTPEELRCERTSVPYAKYCYHHILKDEKQQLFHQCSADISPTFTCSRPSLDLLYEKPLCCEHSTGKEIACHSMTTPSFGVDIPAVPLSVQKPPAKKARRKPQVKAIATAKPAKPNRKTTKKESNKTSKSDKNKKGIDSAARVKQEIMLNHSVSQLNFDKSPLFPTDNINRGQQIYPLNGRIKLEELSSRKSDMFDNDSFKEQELFDDNEMDDSLENDDLSEDLGDISPTAMLRETVLKLPPESPDLTGSLPLAGKRPSPVEAFSEASLHNHIASGNRVELSRKDEISPRVNHSNVIPGLRPSRTSVITLPKYPSSTISHSAPLTRMISPGINADYNAFKPIGPTNIKSEGGARKADPRSIDINQGLPFYPLSFDPVLNSSVTWGGGGKLVLNNRTRPLLIGGQMNPMTFSPPSLSPHISPQITLGTQFNFDRPTVLQHSNSPSPTLSPFSAHLPNSPHSKLNPRTLRLESRSSSSNDIHDPFFGASFDKP